MVLCCVKLCYVMLFNRMYGDIGSAHGAVLVSSSFCLLCFLRAFCTVLSAFCTGRPTHCCLPRGLLGKRCQGLLGECCSVGTSLCVLVYNNCCSCCSLLPGAAVPTCYNIDCCHSVCSLRRQQVLLMLSDLRSCRFRLLLCSSNRLTAASSINSSLLLSCCGKLPTCLLMGVVLAQHQTRLTAVVCLNVCLLTAHLQATLVHACMCLQILGFGTVRASLNPACVVLRHTVVQMEQFCCVHWVELCCTNRALHELEWRIAADAQLPLCDALPCSTALSLALHQQRCVHSACLEAFGSDCGCGTSGGPTCAGVTACAPLLS